MPKTVDARGLACPQPVILTRAALQDADAVLAIVDNETARQNVTRMAEKAGWSVQAEARDDGIYLNIRRAAEAAAIAPAPALASTSAPTAGPLVLVIPGDTMGRGDDELGAILIRGFFHAVGQASPQPDTLIFFNRGVKLVVEGSPVLEDLRALADQGVEILACGTCLGHYGLKEKVAVGEVSNMYTIAETLLRAGKVVYL
ncbi:MAG: sulfurtransferase-like selenium metabolism protein YedF [Anaerolineae bacterium]